MCFIICIWLVFAPPYVGYEGGSTILKLFL
jgi:hypothetical protein